VLQDIRLHAPKLDVGILERLLDAQGVLRDLAHQLFAGTRQVSHWIGLRGTKLALISPWTNKSAIQAASFTSLLRPGTFLMCSTLASASSKCPSSKKPHCFQYTPVAFIAMCVTAR